MVETLPGETDANLEGEIEAGEIGPEPVPEEDEEEEDETVDADERR